MHVVVQLLEELLDFVAGLVWEFEGEEAGVGLELELVALVGGEEFYDKLRWWYCWRRGWVWGCAGVGCRRGGSYWTFGYENNYYIASIHSFKNLYISINLIINKKAIIKITSNH